MARGGRKPRPAESERKCIVTGESGPKEGLLRFVVGPDNRLYPDLAEKLPGRGIWVTSRADCVQQAVNSKNFARAAKAQVEVAAGLMDTVHQGLAERLIAGVSLARKSGDAVFGFVSVEARLREGPVGALIEASDGSQRQCAKLRGLASDAPRMAVLCGQELGVAFGRGTVIHAAVNAGGLTDRILRDAQRLQGFRPEALFAFPQEMREEVIRDVPGDER